MTDKPDAKLPALPPGIANPPKIALPQPLPSKRQSPRLPTMERELSIVLTRALSRLEDQHWDREARAIRARLPITCAISASDQEALVKRLEKIYMFDEEAERDDIEPLARLALSSRVKRDDDLAAFVLAVQGFPLWAIRLAATDLVQKGKPDGGVVEPSDFRKAAETYVLPMRQEAANIRLLLTADVYDDRAETQEETAAKIQAYIADAAHLAQMRRADAVAKQEAEQLRAEAMELERIERARNLELARKKAAHMEALKLRGQSRLIWVARVKRVNEYLERRKQRRAGRAAADEGGP